MKILFLIHSLRRGGAERVVLSQADELTKRGHDVHIISWVDNDEYKDEYIQVSRTHILSQGDYRWIKSLISSSKVLKKRIQDFHPDIIQIHSPSVLWLTGMIKTKIPCIYVLHGYGSIDSQISIKGLVRRLLSNYFAKIMNLHFVTVSSSMILPASNYFCRSPKNFLSISNGINLEEFPLIHSTQLLDSGMSPIILMIGTLTHNKGQGLGIEAFKLLLKQFPEAKLLILGEGEDRPILAAKIKALDLSVSVQLLGLQSNIQSFLSKSTVLWQLSQSEAMPMTVLEAMSSGVPVVGFDVQGINDVVVHDKTGFLVPHGDINQIAKKTAEILKSRSLQSKLALQSRESVRSYFTTEQMVDSYEEYMKTIL